MKIFEDIKDYGDDMGKALQSMLADKEIMNLSNEQARELANNISISDILAIELALENDEIDSIKKVVGNYFQTEATLPGRSNLQSVANDRPEAELRVDPTEVGKEDDDDDQDRQTGTNMSTSNQRYTTGSQRSAVESVDHIRKLAGL